MQTFYRRPHNFTDAYILETFYRRVRKSFADALIFFADVMQTLCRFYADVMQTLYRRDCRWQESAEIGNNVKQICFRASEDLGFLSLVMTVVPVAVCRGAWSCSFLGWRLHGVPAEEPSAKQLCLRVPQGCCLLQRSWVGLLRRGF